MRDSEFLLDPLSAPVIIKAFKLNLLLLPDTKSDPLLIVRVQISMNDAQGAFAICPHTD